jgi:DNA-binding NarL/FixJ family response regulator
MAGRKIAESNWLDGSFYKVSQLMVDGFLNPRHVALPNELCLTSRQREVGQLIAEGKSNKEVAVALGISDKTATHRGNLMRRLNFYSVAEVVRYAVKNGLVQP